jgi:hypothetical protein
VTIKAKRIDSVDNLFSDNKEHSIEEIEDLGISRHYWIRHLRPLFMDIFSIDGFGWIRYNKESEEDE